MAMVPNGLTQNLDQFLKLAPSQSNGLFAREATHDGHPLALPRTILPRPLVFCAR